MEIYISSEIKYKISKIEEKLSKYYKDNKLEIENKDYLYRHSNLFNK
jgi:hypothetical protein